jgi:hypothetical protein
MDWQTPVSLVVVFASMLILVGRLFQSAKGQGGCSDCSSCHSNMEHQVSGQPNLVKLVQLEPSERPLEVGK